MNIERVREGFRWFFFREWAVYTLVIAVTLMLVDVPGVVQSIKIRKLNDMAAGLDMGQLFAFSGEEAAQVSGILREQGGGFSDVLDF